MKKIFPLFFLAIFLFNTGGYYIAFKAQQYSLKKEIIADIQSGIFTTDLTLIAVHKTAVSSINWIEEGEMLFEGEMFDVVTTKETKDSVIFQCINDAKEKTLLAKLDEHISTHVLANAPSKQSKKLSTFSTKLYFSAPQEEEIFSIALKRPAFFLEKPNTKSPFIKMHAPPPECA